MKSEPDSREVKEMQPGYGKVKGYTVNGIETGNVTKQTKKIHTIN